MTEENSYVFTILLKQIWGKNIAADEVVVLNEYKDRSIHHKESVEKFGDIGWINNNLAQLESFPKEMIRQKIKARMAKPGNAGGPGSPADKNYLIATTSPTHIKVHKYWRYAFLILFILTKILLAILIYIVSKYWKYIHTSF